jgi:hypothetical protein
MIPDSDLRGGENGELRRFGLNSRYFSVIFVLIQLSSVDFPSYPLLYSIYIGGWVLWFSRLSELSTKYSSFRTYFYFQRLGVCWIS